MLAGRQETSPRERPHRGGRTRPAGFKLVEASLAANGSSGQAADYWHGIGFSLIAPEAKL